MNYSNCAISSSGQYQSVTVTNGNIYISSDYGENWNVKETTRYWSSIAISASGQYQSAASITGEIGISSDYGNTWETSDFGSPYWITISMSASGQYQTASSYEDALYTSSDYGESWNKNTSTPTNGKWSSTSTSFISASGQYQTI